MTQNLYKQIHDVILTLYIKHNYYMNEDSHATK